jgi:hypothetical protein
MRLLSISEPANPLPSSHAPASGALGQAGDGGDQDRAEYKATMPLAEKIKLCQPLKSSPLGSLKNSVNSMLKPVVPASLLAAAIHSLLDYDPLARGNRLVIANGAEAEVNAGLVELIKDAFTIRIQLLSGSDDSIEAMSGRLGMDKCRLTSLIRLSYLAPDIVRALLEGRQPIELTPTRLLRLSKDLPHDWSEQRHVLGFAA